MFGLLKRLLLDEQTARRALVVGALGAGGFLATGAGAEATAAFLSPELRGLAVVVLNTIGGVGAVQGNGSAPKP